ncbi:uncharacterized protein LOC133825697 [Humulus lupulus]|uniref:uncharacterized protein LOC133825697 n=1 Tax=Humulus lupulus TaxID=3486 RepID=UPI002B40E9EE|nr:uncharacterized protein LOC133825697 [Humulus lupulus]
MTAAPPPHGGGSVRSFSGFRSPKDKECNGGDGALVGLDRCRWWSNVSVAKVGDRRGLKGDEWSILGSVGLFPSKKTKIQILKDVSRRVKPSRMTLLLGPPGARKMTLLLALAGKLDQDLRVWLDF